VRASDAGRRSWPAILAQAAEIIRSYDTAVTLRQLFYRLVSAGTIPNTTSAYTTLSARTAEARRDGDFPDLIDRTRRIHRAATFDDPQDAREWLREIYRRDRTEGQPWSVYLAVEKAGIVEQLTAWFGDRGFPILALGGYPSQTYVNEIVEDVEGQNRKAVLLYAGDFDPSGEDIIRDFIERTDCFDRVIRVALTEKQVREYDLPEQPGKARDTRAKGFVARHGRLVQVEVDALPPDVLHQLFEEALEPFVDTSTFRAVLAQKEAEREALAP
jgi:hypothetical protein